MDFEITETEHHCDSLRNMFLPFALILLITASIFIGLGYLQNKSSAHIEAHTVLLQIQNMENFADMTQIVDVKRRLLSAKIKCSNYRGVTEIFKVTIAKDGYNIQHLPNHDWNGW